MDSNDSSVSSHFHFRGKEKRNGKEEKFDLREFEMIGSSRDSSISFKKKDGLCPRHTRLEWQQEEGRFLVRDLQTPQGTYINGVRVLTAFLAEGDCLKVGKKEMYLVKQKSREKSPCLLEESHCAYWQNQLHKLAQMVLSPFPLFITGASGSGKERVAKYAHRHSAYFEGPFVTVNCTAFTESLIESELFGHQRGSFTGAFRDRLGAFRTANGGSLFLDEIGDLSLGLQSKLLRVLENKEVKPVGMDRVIPVNVRIIAATHQNLIDKVCKGQFRLDLFFRLNILRIHLPSLSERMEDFKNLLCFFARQFHVRFSDKAVQRLKEHSWPGNIRELKHFVTRASVLFNRERITKDMCEELLDRVPDNFGTDIDSQFIFSSSSASCPFSDDRDGNDRGGVPLIKKMERQLIITQLATTNGNQRRAALSLGIPRSTLNDKIRFYKIDLKKILDRKHLVGG